MIRATVVVPDVRLQCQSCDFWCAIDQSSRIRDHASRAHSRPATAEERTPTGPDIQPTVGRVVRSYIEQLANSFEVAGEHAVDLLGRHWCRIGPTYGCVREPDGTWWFAHYDTPVPLNPITRPVTVGVLSRWLAAQLPADPDSAPAYGIPRPIPQLISTPRSV